MKNFQEIYKGRKSIRKFIDKAVEDEKITEILRIINTAPSAGNLQACEVIVVRSKDIRIRVSKAALEQTFIAEAPLVLVFVAKTLESAERYGKRGKELYSVQDATIACTYAMLACEALELSSTWVGAFNDKELMNILNCKRGEVPIAILPVGYTSIPKVSITKRKDLNELSREV